jgi:hypothetical protein
MTILKKNRNTKTYKMIKIQNITVVIQNVPVAHADVTGSHVTGSHMTIRSPILNRKYDIGMRNRKFRNTPSGVFSPEVTQYLDFQLLNPNSNFKCFKKIHQKQYGVV